MCLLFVYNDCVIGVNLIVNICKETVKNKAKTNMFVLYTSVLTSTRRKEKNAG